MVVLGVVLLVIVIVFAVAVGVSNPGVLNLYVFNALVPVTLPGVFFTGAGALLVVLIAGLLIQRGLARSAKLRRQQRALAGAPSTTPTAAPRLAAPPPTTPPPTTPPSTTPPPATSQATSDEPAVPRSHGSHAAPEPSGSERVAPQVTPPSAPVTTVTADPGLIATPTVPTPASSLDLDSEPSSNAAERAATLAEADRLTRDKPLR